MDETIREYLLECYENLDQLDRLFVDLESSPTDRSLLSDIFRIVHTIKGGAGLFALRKLEEVTHAGESLLSHLRDGSLTLHAEMTTALLQMVDAVRSILAHLEVSSNEGPENLQSLIDSLKELQAGALIGPRAPIEPITIQPAAGNANSMPRAMVAIETPPPSPSSQPSTPERAETPPAPPTVVEPLNVERSPAASAERSALSESSIRVDVMQLDKLMNLVGELVLARNQLLQLNGTLNNPLFFSTSKRLDVITAELQERVTKTRMQPISTVWNKLPRMTRDLALACGKQAHVEMHGEDTDMDMTVIEAVRDPMLHLIRNAIDHGLETPEARQAAGKSSEGRVTLNAYHESGMVNIEIDDDGAGIDPVKVRAKAVQKGLIGAEEAAELGDRQALDLVFLPGFSTTDSVTRLSGRGVGMDVVRTHIEKIDGVVELQSVVGRGTTVKLRIPLTLAIVPALIVSCGASRFAIPQLNLLELLRLEGEQVRKGLESVHGVPVFRLRGKLLPLVFLGRELWPNAAHAPLPEVVSIVVLQADRKQFGLIVDRIHDTQEIVVKPLSKRLRGLPLYSGATIMGDAGIALILDVMGLAQSAKVVSETRERLREEQQVPAPAPSCTQRFLFFRGPDDGRMALPLSLVVRLEEFPRTAMEWMGAQAVVQYRDDILPLVDMAEALPERRSRPRVDAPRTDSERIQVVVYSHRGRSVGLIVDRIIDVVEEALTALQPAGREGVKGCLVIGGRITELIDVERIVEARISASLLQGARPESVGGSAT